jgi:hypothetical protein
VEEFMRAAHIATVTAAAGIAVLGAVGPAFAANPIIIQPTGTIAPGANISIFDGGNCTTSTGTATITGPSTMASVALSTLSNQVGGTAVIPASAKPGSYTVTITCGSATFTSTLTIAAGGNMGVNPTGGAATGDGASIGSSHTGLAAGGALAAAGLAIGFVAYRRRRADSAA